MGVCYLFLMLSSTPNNFPCSFSIFSFFIFSLFHKILFFRMCMWFCHAHDVQFVEHFIFIYSVCLRSFHINIGWLDWLMSSCSSFLVDGTILQWAHVLYKLINFVYLENLETLTHKIPGVLWPHCIED